MSYITHSPPMYTVWIHRPSGNDLLVPMKSSRVSQFIKDIQTTFDEVGLFTDETPLVNYQFIDQGENLVVQEDTWMLTYSGLQISVSHDGFLPPADMYDRIFLTTSEAAIHIMTGNDTYQEIEEYISYKMSAPLNYTLQFREEPYDIREAWKTVVELDQELETYMSVTA